MIFFIPYLTKKNKKRLESMRGSYQISRIVIGPSHKSNKTMSTLFVFGKSKTLLNCIGGGGQFEPCLCFALAISKKNISFYFFMETLSSCHDLRQYLTRIYYSLFFSLHGSTSPPPPKI